MSLEDEERVGDLPNEVLAVTAEGRVLEEPRDELVIFHLQKSIFIGGASFVMRIFDQKSIWPP